MKPTAAPARSDSFRPVLGAALGLVLALLAIAALKSSRDLESARARERMLQQKIEATRAESERLRVRIDRLRHDPAMLERLAREDLGMVRPRDVIIELPADPHLPDPPLPEGEEGERQRGLNAPPTPASSSAVPPARE